MQAVEGYFEKGVFYAFGQLFNPPERRRVFVTITDEPVTVKEEQRLSAIRELRKDLENTPELSPEFDDILNKRVSIMRDIDL
ncbi:hypothetical protein FACS1894111_05160 [Clostridia bacterium]|nr:hypothetical protein FACS1894111_05160 [Clostridia bacterium]